MADITQTPANVDTTGATKFADGVAGEAIDAGDLLYINSTDGKLYAADHTTVAKAAHVGMAANSAAINQPVRYATGPQQIGESPATERVNPGGTVAVGQVYVVSANAGKIALESDLSTGDIVSIFGVGVTTSLIEIQRHNTGTAHA